MKEWLKKYWYIPTIVLVVLTIIGLAWSGQTAYETLLKKHNEQVQAHLKEIKDLEEANQRKEIRLQELENVYKETIATLVANYEKNLKTISVKQEKKRSAIVKEANRDPNTLTNKITETFGIPYYKGEVE